MPSCAILSCRLRSQGLKNTPGAVSFHRFPWDPYLKEIWTNATGRKNWVPVKTSTICSNHFVTSDYISLTSCKRILRPGTIPTKNINCIIQEAGDISLNTQLPGPSTQVSRETYSHSTEQQINEKKSVEISCKLNEVSQSDNSASRLRRLRNIIEVKNNVIRNQQRHIRTLQTRNRNLENKIDQLEDAIKKLEEKINFRNEGVATFETCNVKVEEKCNFQNADMAAFESYNIKVEREVEEEQMNDQEESILFVSVPKLEPPDHEDTI